MSKLSLFLTLFFGLLAGITLSQKVPKIKKVNSFSVNTENYFAKINVYRTTDVKIKKDESLMYYWYYANAVHISQGDVGGMVLHGPYTAYYNNENIKEKGEFYKGLKNGKWVTWYENGKINEIFYFDNGQLVKCHYKYASNGNLLSKAQYKKNKLNGYSFIYDNNGNILTKTLYVNGFEKTPEPGFFKKLFSKKNRSSGQDTLKDNSGKPNFFRKFFPKKNNNASVKQPVSNSKTNPANQNNNKVPFTQKIKSWFKKEDGSKKTTKQ